MSLSLHFEPGWSLEVNMVLFVCRQVPVLEIRIQDDRKSRMRRTIPFDCDENAKETRCCRSPLIVNFDDFGWDWVVAPRQYEAFYCNGECPYVFQTSTLNAHIVSQSKTAKVPLCCAPKKMSPLSMIYYNHDLELRYSIVPDSKVESCGCAQVTNVTPTLC